MVMKRILFKSVLRSVGAGLLVLLMANLSFGQVTGDYRTLASSTWNTTNPVASGLWETYNGSAWVGTTTQPGSTNNITIQNTHTVTTGATVSCKNFTLDVGGTFTGNNSLRVYGTTATINGTTTPTNTAFYLEPSSTSGANTVKLTGSATTANFARIRPNSASVTLEIDMNLSLSVTSASAISLNGKSDFTLKINAGKTLSTTSTGNATVGTVSSGEPSTGATMTYDVSGTLSIGGNLNLQNLATFSTTLIVRKGGTVNVGTNINALIGSAATSMNAKIEEGGILAVTGTASITGLNIEYTTAVIGSIGDPIVAPTKLAAIKTLAINNTGGVTLGAATAVTGALTLTSGNLTLGANNLTVGSTAGGSASSHVITDGIGTLSVNCPMSSTTNFPIGATASTYDPVTLNPASTSVVAVKVKATASAADFSGTGGNQITDVSKVAPREWNITPVTPSVTTMALTNGGTTFTPTTALLGHFKSDNTWEALAATYGSNTWTASVSSFSPFGGGDAGGFVAALAIELAKFTAKADGTVNHIAWSTVSEKNNNTFQIERSANGLSFTNIGTVKGSGTTNVGRDYNFTDEAPLPSSSGSAISINYYRLRSVDFDGKSEVSNVVTVFRSTSGKLKVYPNVTSDKLTVSTDSPDGQTYIMTNLLGATVQVGQLTGQKEVFVNGLSAGTYLLKVGSEVVRFVKN
jgi:hypothetical protein